MILTLSPNFLDSSSTISFSISLGVMAFSAGVFIIHTYNHVHFGIQGACGGRQAAKIHGVSPIQRQIRPPRSRPGTFYGNGVSLFVNARRCRGAVPSDESPSKKDCASL
jgi:hypothetical protein